MTAYTLCIEPYSPTQMWAPRPPSPWPCLSTQDLRALLELRRHEPDATVDHDPAAGLFIAEYRGHDTGHHATPGLALAYALSHVPGGAQ